MVIIEGLLKKRQGTMRAAADLKRIILFVAIAVVLSSSAAFADTMNIMGQDLTTAPDRNGALHSVGFINGYINNDPNIIFKFVCVDFGTPIIVPLLNQPAQSYNVNVSSFNTLTGVKFRDYFNNPLLNQYKQAAWLMYQMVNASPADTSAIQFAIWRIFKGEAVPYTQASLQWYNYATDGNHQLSGDQLSLVRVFTPTDGSQELMSIVPIPASVWLLGSGIAVLVAIRRRQRC